MSVDFILGFSAGTILMYLVMKVKFLRQIKAYKKKNAKFRNAVSKLRNVRKDFARKISSLEKENQDLRKKKVRKPKKKS